MIDMLVGDYDFEVELISGATEGLIIESPIKLANATVRFPIVPLQVSRYCLV